MLVCEEINFELPPKIIVLNPKDGDYSGRHFQINGVIRLDYAPLWFFCGLLFEYLNQKNGSTSS